MWITHAHTLYINNIHPLSDLAAGGVLIQDDTCALMVFSTVAFYASDIHRHTFTSACRHVVARRRQTVGLEAGGCCW